MKATHFHRFDADPTPRAVFEDAAIGHVDKCPLCEDEGKDGEIDYVRLPHGKIWARCLECGMEATV